MHWEAPERRREAKKLIAKLKQLANSTCMNINTRRVMQIKGVSLHSQSSWSHCHHAYHGYVEELRLRKQINVGDSILSFYFLSLWWVHAWCSQWLIALSAGQAQSSACAVLSQLWTIEIIVAYKEVYCLSLLLLPLHVL